MAGRNNSGGTFWITLILLAIIAAVLYGCFGQKAGLPPVPGLSPASTASSASSTATASTDASAIASESTVDSASVSTGTDSSAPGGFSYLPATDLIPGSWTRDGSVPDWKAYSNLANWSPTMCFPMQDLGYANSQVFNPGGSNYPTRHAAHNGDQCAPSNYDYPWRDNFCEDRGADTKDTKNIMCHHGYGHQGQDIRPQTCVTSVHWAVAPEAARIKQVRLYTLALRATTPPYRIYRYLHMNPAFRTRWTVGDHVQAGQKLGLIANYGAPGGVIKPYTTFHLHFEMRLDVAETIDGVLRPANTWVPPYTALVAAYQRKLAGAGCPTME